MTRVNQSLLENAFLKARTKISRCVTQQKWNKSKITSERNNVNQRQVPFFLCLRLSLFSVCCSLCYGVNLVHPS